MEVNVDVDRYLDCLKGVSKSVQALFTGIEAVLVLPLIILKERALYCGGPKSSLQLGGRGFSRMRCPSAVRNKILPCAQCCADFEFLRLAPKWSRLD